MVQQNQQIDRQRIEALGPAERIVQALTAFTDHIIHNRPGIVTQDARQNIGARWHAATWKEEDGQKVVYRKDQVGKRKTRTRIGVLRDDGMVVDGRRVVAEYRNPGLFPEAAVWLYRQVADVWKMDNDFAAHWASWAFGKDHKDLKVILAAFMLVQDRCGEPVVEDGEILFHDDDFRAVGEAMCLLRGGFDAKLLLRVGDVLALPGVADINRELGFGRSARTPALGRYRKAVEKWLRYREENPHVLKGLIDHGNRRKVMELARRVGYKPSTPKFFEMLRWKQKQSEDGRREIAIGVEVAKAETWEGLSEQQICEKIVKDKLNYKKVVGLLPAEIGLTRAVMAAVIEAGGLSGSDMIILTPTLEELGLLKVRAIKERWKQAMDGAKDQRAANIAKRVKSQEAREGLEEASDKAAQKIVGEAAKDLRIYVVVDKSASMRGAIEKAKEYLVKLLVGFPLERLHVSVFNTVGTEIRIKGPSAKAVDHAFKSHSAAGGTCYYMGVRVLAQHKPQDGEDSIILFVGDQGEPPSPRLADEIRASGINPLAFGMLNVAGMYGIGAVVDDAANRLQIPCFQIDEGIFSDPYAVTRTIRNLIAATPVGAPTGRRAPSRRKTLVEQILQTPLLDKPEWA